MTVCSNTKILDRDSLVKKQQICNIDRLL